ncbi:MAG: ABC transporter ATP-binding protein [Mobilitalea sp.]
MSYLEIKNLQKKYTENGALIVDNMNLSIEKGEFIVFLGPSGCGKTTTIRMISGLEEVTGGDILVDGESIIHKKPRDRGVSMIFQSYAIWPHMTVFDNIAYPLKLQKVPKAEIKRRVEKAAEATEIQRLLKRYPAQMSGGQRQRVAVSRAIVVEPKLFLMDEPLSNLDAKLRVTMRTELKKIHNAQGSTSIFVTHDQSEAMSMADRIIVMYNGKVEQIGTPMEVYRDSATKFVAEFIGTPPTNFFDAVIKKKDNNLYAEGDGFCYQVPMKLNEALNPYIGKQVDMGIRPEYMELSPELEHTEGYLGEAVINFMEPQGSHSILITNIGKANLKIHTVKYMDIKPGTRISISVKNEMVMFFDCDTSLRIK